MEHMENRKQKAPVGSVLMCLCGVVFLMIEIISAVDLQKAGPVSAAALMTDVFSVLGELALIALGVFSLLRKNAASMVCSAVFLLYEMCVLAGYIVDGSVRFSAAYAFYVLADVALLLVFCVQALPSLASMKKPGGFRSVLPFALRSVGAVLNYAALVLSDDTAVNQNTENNLTSGLLTWLPSFLLFALLAVAVFFVANRAAEPYSNQRNAVRGGAAPRGAQPAYGQQPMAPPMGDQPDFPAYPTQQSDVPTAQQAQFMQYAQPGQYAQPEQLAQPGPYTQPALQVQPGQFAQTSPNASVAPDSASSVDVQPNPTVVLPPEQKGDPVAAALPKEEPFAAPAAPQMGGSYAMQGDPAQNLNPAVVPVYAAPAAPQMGGSYAAQGYPAQNAAPAAAPSYAAPVAPPEGIPFAPQGYPAQNAAPAALPVYAAPAAPQSGAPFSSQGDPAQNATSAAPVQSGEDHIALMQKRYRTLLDAGLISQEKYDERIKHLLEE